MSLPKRKNMTLREQETAAKAQCHDWNTTHPEGAAVFYEELLGSGEKIKTKTRGKAYVHVLRAGYHGGGCFGCCIP